MQFKHFGAFHFNNDRRRITFVGSLLHLDKLIIHDTIWSQWEDISPKTFYNILKHCTRFTKYGVVGYNRYDVNEEFTKHLSKFPKVIGLNITHTVYDQILNDAKPSDGPNFISLSPDGMVREQLPYIAYHTENDRKIIHPSSNHDTDYGMAYLICYYMGVKYMRKKQLI